MLINGRGLIIIKLPDSFTLMSKHQVWVFEQAVNYLIPAVWKADCIHPVQIQANKGGVGVPPGKFCTNEITILKSDQSTLFRPGVIFSGSVMLNHTQGCRYTFSHLLQLTLTVIHVPTTDLLLYDSLSTSPVVSSTISLDLQLDVMDSYMYTCTLVDSSPGYLQ